ncbi:hypothetical protein CCH79_00000656 [Gambusia affinis]|uniref:Fibrillar collagen NC1 domain-containing protein n=1 Tax=Gambusia affinis TaxID=33528 RepID=A0A315VUI8_GAMAF|nr:hypothetical protein CCH79_00000656 [Gambusia affinis]
MWSGEGGPPWCSWPPRKSLMYLSDKPNFSLIQTLLDSLQQELRLLLDPPDGTKLRPATTCLELWLCHPEFSSGMYYIDPNQGSSADALLAYCSFTSSSKQTCLHPELPQLPMKAWMDESAEDGSFYWLSRLDQGESVVQMRFLRLHSVSASQTVTYSCHPGSRLGPTDTEVKFLTDTRMQSYLGELNHCVPVEEAVSSSGESVLEFEDLQLLPLRDVAVMNSGNFTHQFSFTVGPTSLI